MLKNKNAGVLIALNIAAAAAPAAAQVALPPQAAVPQTAGTGPSPASPAGRTAPPRARSAPEEIIVTANKRRELARQVANSVTALSGRELARRAQVTLQDFVAEVPGMSLEADDKTAVRIVLRGLNTGGSGNTVASVLDEVPTTGATAQNNAAINTPNFDTYDLQRIEVLRGPQSSLYGATAEGGLVKYVTNPPDPTRYSGELEGGINGTTAGGIGGTMRGFVNLPLADGKAALRATAWNEFIPGYVDDPQIGKKDSNSGQQYGYRLSGYVEPVEGLTIRLTAQRESLFSNNADYVQAEGAPSTQTQSTPIVPSLGQLDRPFGLINNTHFSQPSQAETAVYYANVNDDWGWANLTSVTSYTFNKFSLRSDYGNVPAAPGFDVGAYLQDLVYGEPVTASLLQNSNTGKFNEEVRLTSDTPVSIVGIPVDYLGGVYYTHESAVLLQNLVGRTVAPHQSLLDPPLGALGISSALSEWAVFGQLDIHLLPTFDLALGGRLTGNDQHAVTSFTNGVLTGVTTNTGVVGSNDHDQLYTIAPRWRPNEDTTVYARIATGYRPGGPNQPVPGVSGLPTFYQSDRVVNYEVGWRQDFFDKCLSADLTGFWVNWKRVQVLSIIDTPSGTFSVEGNAGSAVSKGIEWSFRWMPITGLTLTATGSYTDARLTADAPGLGAANGDFLPYVPDVTNSVNAEYAWNAFGDYRAFVSGTWSYTGQRYTGFTPTTTILVSHVHLPSYNTGSLRGGIEDKRYSFEAYVNNVGDARGITYYASAGGAGATGQEAILFPRLIGATIRVKF